MRPATLILSIFRGGVGWGAWWQCGVGLWGIIHLQEHLVKIVVIDLFKRQPLCPTLVDEMMLLSCFLRKRRMMLLRVYPMVVR